MDRLDFYLIDPDGPIMPGFSKPRATDFASCPAAKEYLPVKKSLQHPSTPTLSNASTVSASTYDASHTLSRASTIASYKSASTIPPWHAETATLNQQLVTMPLNYSYHLPCEFAFIGCKMRFEPGEFEDWISHTESHFREHLPPPYAICVFCDVDPARCFQSHDDPYANWRERMVHIGSHFQDGQDANDMRPDYWVIQYMKDKGLVHEDDHTFTHPPSERPFCDKLVPRDFETPEMKERKDRNMRQDLDLEKERQYMRKLRLQPEYKTCSDAPRPQKSWSVRLVQGYSLS